MSTQEIVAPQQQPRWLSRIKAMYVSTYLTGASIGTGVAVYRLATEAFSWAWLGVLFTTLPFMLVLMRAFVLKNVARTAEHMTLNVVLGLIGVGVAVASVALQNTEVLAALIAILLFIGYLLYDYWYSDLGREESELLAVGQVLPHFTVQRADGREFDSQSLAGSPALILFFRGNWCPFCVAQIREIVASYQELANRGVKVLFISPQTDKHTADLAKQFAVPCEFLSDEGNKAANRLGIAADGGLPMGMEVLGYDSDTVLPTALVIDAQGKIIYSDQTANYRVRPEPQAYIDILDKVIPIEACLSSHKHA